jgi:hypothetical protein
MTAEEHLRTIVGDLVLRIAQLAAEVDTVKEKLASHELEVPIDPSPITPRVEATP